MKEKLVSVAVVEEQGHTHVIASESELTVDRELAQKIQLFLEDLATKTDTQRAKDLLKRWEAENTPSAQRISEFAMEKLMFDSVYASQFEIKYRSLVVLY